MVDLVIRGGQVVAPWGVGAWDVAVQGEKIVAVAEPGSLPGEMGRVIDATGQDRGAGGHRAPRPRRLSAAPHGGRDRPPRAGEPCRPVRWHHHPHGFRHPVRGRGYTPVPRGEARPLAGQHLLGLLLPYYARRGGPLQDHPADARGDPRGVSHLQDLHHQHRVCGREVGCGTPGW